MSKIDINQYAIRLSKDGHDTPQEGMCIMECVAYIQGEEHSDQPKCASPFIGKIAMCINDNCAEKDRDSLIKYVFRLAGSRRDMVGEKQYMLAAANFIITDAIPRTLAGYMLPNTLIAKYRENICEVTDLPTLIQAADAVSYLTKYGTYNPFENGHRALVAMSMHVSQDDPLKFQAIQRDNFTATYPLVAMCGDLPNVYPHSFELVCKLLDRLLPDAEDDVTKAPELTSLVQITNSSVALTA